MTNDDDSDNSPHFEEEWEWESPRDVAYGKLSAKYEGEKLVGYSLRDFVDEDTPHGNWDGTRKYEFHPEELRKIGDAIDMALMNAEEI